MTIKQNRSAGGADYAKNFEKAFGTEEERKARALAEINDAKPFKLTNSSAYLLKPFEPFLSPIDNKMVNSRAELEAHNRRHEVTDCRDYSEEHFTRKAEQRQREMIGDTPEAKKERQQLIERQLYRYGILK